MISDLKSFFLRKKKTKTQIKEPHNLFKIMRTRFLFSMHAPSQGIDE